MMSVAILATICQMPSRRVFWSLIWTPQSQVVSPSRGVRQEPEKTGALPSAKVDSTDKTGMTKKVTAIIAVRRACLKVFFFIYIYINIESIKSQVMLGNSDYVYYNEIDI